MSTVATTKKTKYVNFSMPVEYRDLLEQIAKIDQRSMTNAMQVMITQKARELNLLDGAPGRTLQSQN